MEHNRTQFARRANAALTEPSREIRVDEKTPESQRRFRSHEEPAPPHETDASENLTEDMIGASDSFSPKGVDSCPLTVRDAAVGSENSDPFHSGNSEPSGEGRKG
jgi:hypothetical protein